MAAEDTQALDRDISDLMDALGIDRDDLKDTSLRGRLHACIGTAREQRALLDAMHKHLNTP